MSGQRGCWGGGPVPPGGVLGESSHLHAFLASGYGPLCAGLMQMSSRSLPGAADVYRRTPLMEARDIAAAPQRHSLFHHKRAAAGLQLQFGGIFTHFFALFAKLKLRCFCLWFQRALQSWAFGAERPFGGHAWLRRRSRTLGLVSAETELQVIALESMGCFTFSLFLGMSFYPEWVL